MDVRKLLRKRLRIPIRLRVVVIVMAVLSLCVGGIRHTFSTPNQFGCIYFQSYLKAPYSQHTGIVLVDLRTQALLQPYRMVAPTYRYDQFVADPSPDGKLRVFLSRDPASPSIQVYIDRKNGSPILLQDRVEAFVAAVWSPDSLHLAFVWRSGQFFRVNVVNSD